MQSCRYECATNNTLHGLHDLLRLYDGGCLQLICICCWHVLRTEPDYLQFPGLLLDNHTMLFAQCTAGLGDSRLAKSLDADRLKVPTHLLCGCLVSIFRLLYTYSPFATHGKHEVHALTRPKLYKNENPTNHDCFAATGAQTPLHLLLL